MDEGRVAAASFETAVQSYYTYGRTRELKQLDVAVQCARVGCEVTGQSHANHAGLSFLAATLGTRFERSGEMKDLEEAIDTARRAVQSTPPDHPGLAMYSNNLGNWLGRRFERSGER
jgi:hypothetical protein